MKQIKNPLVKQFIKEHTEMYGSFEDELLKKRVFGLLNKLKVANQELASAELRVKMAKENIKAVEQEIEEAN